VYAGLLVLMFSTASKTVVSPVAVLQPSE